MKTSQPTRSQGAPPETIPVMLGAGSSWERLGTPIFLGACLVAATLGVYGEIGGNDFFNLDDDTYVLLNPHVRSGLTGSNTAWALTAFHAGNWHPLTWLSLQLDSELFGRNPAGYHWVNVVLHAANTLLLFGWLRWLTGAVWRSVWVASLFALHPLHVESVAWLAERKDVLSTLFWMLTLLTYSWYAQRPGWGRYGLVVLVLALGLMAKPMLVTLPFVLLLVDYWPLNRWQRAPPAAPSTPPRLAPAGLGRLVLEKVPLLILAAGACGLTVWAQSQGNLVQSLDEVALPQRIANGLVAYVRYIGMMFWPLDLAVYYPHPRDTLPIWPVLAAGGLLVLISVAVIKAGRRRPYLPAGWFWYLGTLVPVIGLVQVGTQALADRYTYVPLIGLFVGLVWRVSEWWMDRGFPEVILAALAGFTVALLMLLTWLQVGYWADSITMWGHTLDVTSNNYVAHNQLGLAYLNERHPEQALPHFREAARLRPDLPDMRCGVGAALFYQGKPEEALTHFEAALSLARRNPKTHIYLGQTYWVLGKIDQAVDHFATVLEIDSRQMDAHLGLARIYEQQGNSDAAARHRARAREIDPDKGRVPTIRGR